jgi:hypothetical protein
MATGIFKWAGITAILVATMMAKPLHAQVNNPKPLSLTIGTWSTTIPAHFPVTNRLFPQHVLHNPLGYSPLCRMEVQIEKQSPVGVWMRLDGNGMQGFAHPGWASVRFKLPLRKP